MVCECWHIPLIIYASVGMKPKTRSDFHYKCLKIIEDVKHLSCFSQSANTKHVPLHYDVGFRPSSTQFTSDHNMSIGFKARTWPLRERSILLFFYSFLVKRCGFLST